MPYVVLRVVNTRSAIVPCKEVRNRARCVRVIVAKVTTLNINMDHQNVNRRVTLRSLHLRPVHRLPPRISGNNPSYHYNAMNEITIIVGLGGTSRRVNFCTTKLRIL